MAKVIRPTYPREFSIGLLLLIFALSSLLSFEIFAVKWYEVMEGGAPLVGMLLSGVAVVLMALILWEDFLFPVRLTPSKGEIVFRNHSIKLRTQVLIYCVIPLIVVFIYLNYNVNFIAFSIWASVCVISPVVGKLLSGIKNYNDYLKLTDTTIEFRNNDKRGVLSLAGIDTIALVKDEQNVLHRISIAVQNNREEVLIDLDEMELEAYLETIEEFMRVHYGQLMR